jgi:ATP-binding cassette subfamily B protein
VAETSRLSIVGGALSTSWHASRRGTVAAAALQLVGALGALGAVLVSKLALDSLLEDGTGLDAGLVGALVLLAATTALSGSVGVLQQQHQRVQGERVGQLLWRNLLAACAAVDLTNWQSTAFMDRLDRVRANALHRPVAVISSLFALLGSVLGVVAMGAALVAIEPLLLPVLLLAGVPAVAMSRLASRSEFRFAAATNPVSRRRLYLKQLLTSRSSAAEVRAFDAGPRLLERHAAEDRAHLAALRRQARHRQLLGLVTTGASAGALAATLLLIVAFVRDGRLSLAEAGAAAIAARLLGSQLGTVFGSIGTLIESGPFLADMRAFLGDVPSERRLGTVRSLERELTVDDVHFGYAGQDRPAVAGVSLVIPSGTVVALVGENGSGKSTLAKIVCGLYPPDAGKVLWDGDGSVSPADLRASSSILFQDFVHYQMSAADNVAIARSSDPPDRRAVESAARRAGVHDALAALPDGYDTVLGVELAEGSDLSGGQWQRLALARAFYRDRSLVVLDEPTAALDARAEHELFADVRTVLDGRSALLISHRYSSVRLADYIYVMHEGRVAEEGTHDQLIALRGRYAELYTLQAAAFLE